MKIHFQDEIKQIPSDKPSSFNLVNKISEWDVDDVKQWLERVGLLKYFWIKISRENLSISILFSLSRAFLNIDGKLLGRLYQMKQLASDAYYKFIDKYFDRIQIARMSDILKFDYELENLFQ